MTVPEFLDELRDVMQLVRIRLASRKAGVPGEESIEDLEVVLRTLTELEGQVVFGNLPSKDQRDRPGLEAYALDSWGYRSQLAHRISSVCVTYHYSLE